MEIYFKSSWCSSLRVHAIEAKKYTKIKLRLSRVVIQENFCGTYRVLGLIVYEYVV